MSISDLSRKITRVFQKRVQLVNTRFSDGESKMSAWQMR